MRLKLKFLVYGLFFGGMTWQNLALAANESLYCDTSWWETATPADLDQPIENVNEIVCEYGHGFSQQRMRIIHTALRAEDLDPETFSKFLQVNKSELNLEAGDHSGMRPIFYAVYHPDPAFIRSLLTAGVEVEVPFMGMTVLIFAAQTPFSSPEVMQALLDDARVDKDASFNVLGYEGWNALHIAAAEHPNPKVLQTLLDAGFEKSAKTADGLTAYDIAIDNFNEEVAEVLK